MVNPLLYSAWAANRLSEILWAELSREAIKPLISTQVLNGIIENEFHGKVMDVALFRLRERFLIPDIWYVSKLADGRLMDSTVTFDEVREKILDDTVEKLAKRVLDVYQDENPNSIRFIRPEIPALEVGKGRFRADINQVSLLCSMGYSSKKQATEVEFCASFILDR